MFVEPLLKRLEHKIQSTVSHASAQAPAPYRRWPLFMYWRCFWASG